MVNCCQKRRGRDEMLIYRFFHIDGYHVCLSMPNATNAMLPNNDLTHNETPKSYNLDTSCRSTHVRLELGSPEDVAAPPEASSESRSLPVEIEPSSVILSPS